MASKYYSLLHNETANPENVTVDTSSTAAADIEVRIETGNNMTTLEISERLDAIKRHLLDGRYNILSAV